MATNELLNFTQLPGGLTEYLEHLTVNTKVATVLGSISAFPQIYRVESEGAAYDSSTIWL
jgi:hypothetical protein